MIAPADLEGGFTLRLVLRGALIASASLHSERPLVVTKALIGQAPEDAIRLIGRLFPICGQAQTAAGLGALEAAMGLDPGTAHLRARDLVVACEMAQSHAWRICIDWADLIDEARDLSGVADMRGLVADVPHSVFGQASWAQLGGGATSAGSEALGEAVMAIGAWLRERILGDCESPHTIEAIEAWAQQGATLPARLVALAHSPEHADIGSETVNTMTIRDPNWFAARLSSDPDFSARPTVDGAASETGAFADRAHPLAEPLLAAWGPGLAVRFALQALDAVSLADRISSLLNDLSGANPVAETPRQEPRFSGEGCAVAETIRGPVAHWARLEDHCIVDYRTVAPSEWNFHPDGALVRALTGVAPVAGAERMARMMGAALDPCAPLRVLVDREEAGPADA